MLTRVFLAVEFSGIVISVGSWDELRDFVVWIMVVLRLSFEERWVVVIYILIVGKGKAFVERKDKRVFLEISDCSSLLWKLFRAGKVGCCLLHTYRQEKEG